MTTSLTFQNTKLSVINQNNQIWLSALDVGKSLGYSQPVVGVTKIYDRHHDEFTEKMTALIEMPTAGGLQKVRIFSLRGAHLIGMFSHTKIAKDFRKWVLDVLEQVAQPQQLALPEPEKFTFEFTEYELQELAWLWFAFKRGVGTFQHIEKAFNVLGSNMSGQIYGQAYEYLSVLRSTNQILNRITSDFNIDPMTNWRVLKHLRGFNPKAVKIDF